MPSRIQSGLRLKFQGLTTRPHTTPSTNAPMGAANTLQSRIKNQPRVLERAAAALSLQQLLSVWYQRQ